MFEQENGPEGVEDSLRQNLRLLERIDWRRVPREARQEIRTECDSLEDKIMKLGLKSALFNTLIVMMAGGAKSLQEQNMESASENAAQGSSIFEGVAATGSVLVVLSALAALAAFVAVKVKESSSNQ